MARAPVRHALGALAIGIGLVATAVGCADSDYTYVNGASSSTYFKVPKDWQVFRVDTTEPPQGRPEAITGDSPVAFHVVFDGAEQADVNHLLELAPAAPVGQVQVIDLDANAKDDLSLTTLRVFANGGTDPFEEIGEDLEVVRYDDIATADGFRGKRLVLNKRIDGTWVTIDQKALFDAGTTRLYLMQVRCASTCYLDNKPAIEQIVDSWTVRKK